MGRSMSHPGVRVRVRVRVRAGTERTTACCLILPSEGLVAPLSQMLWSDEVAKNGGGEMKEVGMGRQIQ